METYLNNDNSTNNSDTCSKLIKEEPIDELLQTLSINYSTPCTNSSNNITRCFKSNELRQALMPIVEKLYYEYPESIPFREPVDPILLNIPDYFEIIKKPMDLSTIKRKLEIDQYQDPWQFIDDMWLIFENAWLYNKKESKVYRCCIKLKEVFEAEINPVMHNLGYCYGRKYVFQHQDITKDNVNIGDALTN